MTINDKREKKTSMVSGAVELRRGTGSENL